MLYHVLFILLATSTATTTAQSGPGPAGNPTWATNQVSGANPSILPPTGVQGIPPTTTYPPSTNVPTFYGANPIKGSNKNNQNDNLGFAFMSLDNALFASSALANGTNLSNDAFSSSSNSVAITSANIGKILFSLPKCFTKCATDSSNSLSFSSGGVGGGYCSGLMNFQCNCEKPQFVDMTISCAGISQSKDCVGLSFYPHLLQQGHDIFTNLCKAAGVSQSSQPSSMIIPSGSATGTRSSFRPYGYNSYNNATQQHSLHQLILTLGILASIAILGIL